MEDLRLSDRLLRHDRLITAVALFSTALVAAAVVASGGGTGMSALGLTAQTGAAGSLLARTPDMTMAMGWTLSYALVVFTMWWMMMIAMMVPSAAPTILLFSALNSRQGQAAPLLFLAGYLAIWGVFSVMATAAQAALATTGLMSPMFMTLAAPLLGAAFLICAGFYQFSPLKTACLAHCRGPVEALTRHRRTGRAAAFRMGMLHGRFCVGCCWALMALLFVGGIMNVWWIVGITLCVAVEKLAPGGNHLSRLFGAGLVVGGLGLFLRAVISGA